MKIILAAVFIFIVSLTASGQQIIKYYDFQHKECPPSVCRYCAFLEQVDSTWYLQEYFVPEKTLLVTGSFTDSTCLVRQGEFVYYFPNKKVKGKGLYKNNKKEGPWLFFHQNGVMADTVMYVNGQPKGMEIKRHPNGFISDSIYWKNDGYGNAFSWFDNGVLSGYGLYAPNGKMDGKWQFFHSNGKPSAEEMYIAGKRLSQKYYDEQGNALPDTINTDREADYAGGTEKWSWYLQRHLDPNVPIRRNAPVGRYTVTIQFIVDTLGNISDMHPLTEWGYGMEEEAEKMIRNSLDWEPAIQHGRKVKTYRVQPITFVISNGYNR